MADESADPAQFAMYPSLRGRVVLITGGTTGIGKKLVEAFAAQAAQVVFIGNVNQAAAASIARLTPTVGVAPAYFRCDLRDLAALESCLFQIAERFGTIDVVIHNAGDDADQATEDVTPEFNDRCGAMDRKHQRFISQATVPGIRWQGRGVILHMSSLANGTSGYVASKAATVDLTRALGRELRPHDVRVHCLLPGAVERARERRSRYSEENVNEVLGRQAIKRLLQPDEVAQLALFLSSDDGSEITKQSGGIEGGWIE